MTYANSIPLFHKVFNTTVENFLLKKVFVALTAAWRGVRLHAGEFLAEPSHVGKTI
jgi:hypothetical protein